MERRRPILPSSYTLPHPPLDDPSGFSRVRQPLADSAGNAQHHTLASTPYHGSRGHQPRERSVYSIPTVPSQPPRQSAGNTLKLRRQTTRRQRHMRYSRNPIVESSQYQAYRERQERAGGNGEDSKWPQELELAFLDALMKIPAMGRRKFSYHGKPHGRNELIKEYIWIAYLESLPPGARPDESMRRTRKQVSSHIQVLKAFLKDHPAFDRLFPPAPTPQNGFEDSFKNDPCLTALANGHLPREKRTHYEQTQMSTSCPMRPVLFWLLMTSSSSSVDDRNRDVHEEDLYMNGLVAHRFTGLQMQRSRASLEAISDWRQRFPFLHQLYTSGELDCEIIHMEASLNLLTAQPPEGSDLCSRTVLSMPGRQIDTDWRIVTTLSKPPELYRDPVSDPPLEAQVFLVEVTCLSDGETHIKIPFPASSWAQTFSCLQNIQSKYEGKLQHSFNNGMGRTRPASDYVDQISMYQEVQSSAGPGHPFVRRAIMLWTFRQAPNNERGNSTNWRYLDANTPPRRMCMSPSPHPHHHIQASMNENFNTWSEAPVQLQQSSMIDPFPQGLVTPPHTAGLQSPFSGPNYTYAPPFDLPGENLSFISNTDTIDSETTLVDNDVAANIDSFLANSHVNLHDFEPASQSWQQPATDSFEDPTWASYAVPSSTPAPGWDSNEVKQHAWPDLPVDMKSWQIETENGEKSWVEHGGNSSAKGGVSYIEPSIEQRQLPWIDSHRDDEVKNTYEDVVPIESHIQSIDPHGSETDVQEGHEPELPKWNEPPSDFDYRQLDRLK
ncbi:hypothetical protein QTJ16_005008 [Diplocarpon rosae]|uniref:TEA domain-containing protein n=1 Tax=Diplocarpon rosae TaxID=946125 RepID=A0AAD9WDT3_9HELO|nr:hypothetical protein QTJ16_005008 [Diplocarpon rosae]